MHGECLAQMMLQDAKTEYEASKQREQRQKVSRRVSYQIGWKVAEAPSCDVSYPRPMTKTVRRTRTTDRMGTAGNATY